jgi:hypothetical protein
MSSSPFNPILLQMLATAAASEDREAMVEAFIVHAGSLGKDDDESVQYLIGMAFAMLNRRDEALKILRQVALRSDLLGKLAATDIQVLEKLDPE